MGTQIREIKALLTGAAITMLATFFVINYLDSYLHGAPIIKSNTSIPATDTASAFKSSTANYTLVDSNVYTAGQ